jgi:hypothetical protein
VVHEDDRVPLFSTLRAAQPVADEPHHGRGRAYANRGEWGRLQG